MSLAKRVPTRFALYPSATPECVDAIRSIASGEYNKKRLKSKGRGKAFFDNSRQRTILNIVVHYLGVRHVQSP